jgi:hypothetical protein
VPTQRSRLPPQSATDHHAEVGRSKILGAVTADTRARFGNHPGETRRDPDGYIVATATDQ